MQVFTRDGWLWVNPYVTLISAYERLIHGRGREIGPEPAESSAVAAFASPMMAHALVPPAVAHASASPAVIRASPEDVIDPDIQEGGDN